MKWMKNWKQNTRRAAALVLGAVLVIANLGAVSYAEENSEAESVVGYSDALVEKKDLSTVTSYTVYKSMETEEKASVTEIKIGTAQELWNFSKDFPNVADGYEGKTIYLDNDIKMTDINQIPMPSIGYYDSNNNYKTFKGTFDGQGHEVNVVIDSNYNGAGLFGAMGKGTIKNLIFSGSVVGGKNQVGGIVGYVSGSAVTIENCYNKANVTSTFSTGGYVGGIVGFINGGNGPTISNCTNEGDISALKNLGGIVGGSNSSVTIKNCRNLGEVKSTDWSIPTSAEADQPTQGCGGIVGSLKNNPTTLTNCINDGAVRTWSCMAAGIVGNVQIAGCKLSEVYNYGTVTNSATNGAANSIYNSSTGVSGILENEINVVNSTTPEPEDTALTNAAKEADISIVSVTKDIVGYSDARVVRVDLTDVPSMTDYLAATDTSGIEKVKISTVKELQDFISNCTSKSGYSGLTVYLANDIDMTGKSMTSSGTAFQGTFDGQGYEIAGLSIARTDYGTGFFRYAASGAIIRNLILSGTISGVSQAGSIVGNVNNGEVTIENCYNRTAVTGTGTFVGGIVGIVTNLSGVKVTITNCTNAGAVQSESDVGGIVGGALYSTTVTNCRNAGTVKATAGSSTKGCGSIVGAIKNQTTTITGCINNGSIISGSCATAEDTSYGYRTSGTAKVSNMQDYSSDNTADTSYEVAAIYADTLIGTNAGMNRKEVASITKDIVGYSDARVEYVDLSQVMDFTTYKASDDKSGITKIKVCTAEELKALRGYFPSEKVGGYNEKMTIYLANDIDASELTMAPIGTKDYPFKGTFDGQGYEISNLNISSENVERGLFGCVDGGAVIKNVIFSGSIKGASKSGGIVGNVAEYNPGSVIIENCYNKASVESTGTYAGGIAGIVANKEEASLTISNCTNAGAIQATNVGGLVGGALHATTIINSRNMGTVTNTAGTIANGCGGLAGIVKNQAITINGSINNGAIDAGACTGAGIIGTIEKVKGCSIADTTNYGTVAAGNDGEAYAVYGMTTGAYVKEDGYAIADKTGETDAGMELAKAEGTKHTGWTVGDANGDEAVDVRDLVRIKRHAKDSTVEIYNGADADRDNVVTDADTGACRIILLNQVFYSKALEGLTVNALGDSYFQGATLPQDQVWLHLLAGKYNMNMNNYGIGGSTVSDSKDGYYNPMVGRYTDLIKADNDPDIILVEGGRNDFNYHVEPGEISLENADKTTYVGALNIIIDGLQEAYPDAMIVCVTPWNFPDKDVDNNGVAYQYTYLDYCNAMVEIAKLQGVKCIEAYKPEVSGIDMRADGFSEKYTVDQGVSHLNLEGMKIVMPRFEKLLAEFWEEFNYEK